MSTKMQEWEGHVRRWRDSGQTRAAYCAAHGLKVNTLSDWVWKLGHMSSSVKAVAVAGAAFVPIQVPLADAATTMVEVRWSAQGSVRVPVEIDVAWTAALVKALTC